LKNWLREKNSQKNQAHGQIPNDLLEKEQEVFEPFREKACSYGILHSGNYERHKKSSSLDLESWSLCGKEVGNFKSEFTEKMGTFKAEFT